ncbi:hypothetical protein [Synechococcus sp. GFB01]|uniref:hypothetical protein n=1 Tax=Synechococcus sp. GFB01 TaxID=1662190 RepID=UPI00064E2C12|nr:hypothetical protein [Synechococcus sp. GFB01]KMM16896.1 hypothetical protein SYNGFB01_07825 [Synechococcus sp. GFB01]
MARRRQLDETTRVAPGPLRLALSTGSPIPAAMDGGSCKTLVLCRWQGDGRWLGAAAEPERRMPLRIRSSHG